MKTFSKTIKVLPEQIDALGHVNNIHYLQWVQEVAQAHWEKLTQEVNSPLGIWVVRSHNITYKYPALEGEFVLLKTHVKQSRGVLSERIVEILNTEQKLLAVCSTQWCYLDKESKKATPIPQEIIRLLHG